MSKAYTIRDIAKEAGVGVGTVSRVLNDHPSVSEHTRQKVRDAIEKLDYRPNAIARQLSSGKRSLAVGIIVPFFTRHAFVGRLQGVEAALAQTDYDLILYNVETPAQRNHIFAKVADEKRVDGVIAIALDPNPDEINRFKRAGIPLVLIDAQHDHLPSVQINDFDGGRQITQYLVDIGHKDIAFIGDYFDTPFGFQSTRQRYDGYRSVLALNDLYFVETYLRLSGYGRHHAYTQTEALLDLPQIPSAIFASSDMQALGAIEAIQDRGLSVPGDISVAGYDDIEIATYVGLTTIHQPLYQSGIEGVTLLFEALANNPVLRPGLTQILSVDLIIRDTTSPPRQ